MSTVALEPGDTLDGFVIDTVLHAGSMARIFTVHYAQGARDPGFPMVMKVPRMGSGDGPETIVGFETEHRLLPLLTGPHVPRFVACGDLAVHPYLVIERVPGRTYQELLDQTPRLEVDRGRRDGHGAGAGLPQPASAKRGASGPEARQRDVARRRHRRSAGLRAVAPRRASRSAGRGDAPADRHPCLHGARAGARHSRRFAQRPVCRRRHPLRDADRRTAFRRPEDGGRPAPAPVDGSGAAAAPASRHSSLAAGGGLAPAGAPGRTPISVGQAPGVRSRESRPGRGHRARPTPARHALAPAPAALAARGRPAVPPEHHAVAPDR